MTKTLTFLLLALLAMMPLAGQITLGSDQMPSEGTQAVIATVANPLIDLGTASADAQNWDFVNPGTAESGAVQFNSVAGTIAENDFASSEFTRNGFLNELLGVDLAEVVPLDLPEGTAYYSTAADGSIVMDGVSMDNVEVEVVGALGQVVLNAEPSFPFWSTGEYGNTSSSNSLFTMLTPLPDGGILQGTVGLYVTLDSDLSFDAHGTLELPESTHEVLRTTEEIEVTIVAGLYSDPEGTALLFGLVDTVFTTYIQRYYSESEDYPVATVNYTIIDGVQSINTIEYNAAGGMTGDGEPITIVSADLPTIMTNVLVATVPNPDLAAAGTDEAYVLDFSSLEKIGISEVDFIPTAGTIDEATYPNADFARVGPLSSLLGVEIGDLLPIALPDATAYYAANGAGNVAIQGASIILNIAGVGDLGLQTLDADPDFESWSTGEFGDNFNKATSFELVTPLPDDIGIPGAELVLTVELDADVSIDGHGTLVLPDYTEETLRYTELNDITVNAGIYVFGFEVQNLVDTNFVATTINYYANDRSYPMATVSYLGDEIPASIQYQVVPDAPELSFVAQSQAGKCLTVDFDNTTAGFVSGYEWTFGDEGTSTEESPTFTFGAAGDYEVNLSGVTFDGQVLSTSMTVTVICATPEPSFTNFNQSENCLEVSFLNGTSGDAASYSWDFGDETSAEDLAPVHTYTEEGIYEVSLTAIGFDGVEQVFTAEVVVNCSELVADFSSAASEENCGEYSFANMSTGVVTNISWDFGDGSTAEDETPSHAYAANGMYTVTLTVFSGNEAPAVMQQVVDVSCFVGIETALESAAYTIFPNPTTGNLTVVLEEALKQNAEYLIYSANGQLVRSIFLAKGNDKFQFDLADLASGLYSTLVQSANGQLLLREQLIIK